MKTIVLNIENAAAHKKSMKKVPDLKRRIFFCQVHHFAKKFPDVKYKEMGIEEIE